VTTVDQFRTLWETLLPIGRLDGAGSGYARHGWNDAEMACREWFAAQAAARRMPVEVDGNGNLWAWWGDPAAGPALVTGSHLDSVPAGGAYDGPLGVVAGFLAVDLLRERGVTPSRPVAVVAFCEEEGARFGIACLGSRLLTGALDADRAADLRDADGTTLAAAMAGAGADPGRLGADPERLARIGCYLELHIEQGRALADPPASWPVGVASAIWPHGRWRFDFTGEANHAGTTRMDDRHDPMLAYAMTVLAANKQARLHGARATFGRVEVSPNGTNAIPDRVTGWLDARAADQSTLDAMLAGIRRQADDRVHRDGTTLTVTPESVTGELTFDRDLAKRVAVAIGEIGPHLAATDGPTRVAPVLATGAGHDAGVLAAAGVPTAMVFVRNPTGVSHSPAELADDADCAAGVVALAAAMEDLA
jgi:N-carbamoyl-L-amino-acid hydrolase